MALTISGSTGLIFPNGGTSNPSGTVVGTTDVQTLSSKTLNGATINTPTINTPVISGMSSSIITSGTAVASTSGTSIDFTSIPSWVKRVTVMFNGVSTNGTSLQQIQLGVSGVPETSGYSAVATYVSTTNNTTRGATATSGFIFSYSTGASETYSGSVVFTLLGSNTWTCIGALYDAAAVGLNNLGGVKGLAGTLNMVRITTVNGTDAFDAGSINIMYE